MIGEVHAELGDDATARDLWNRALFGLRPGATGTRRDLLVRLATLEERDGRASVALRHWQAVLALEPEHAGARARVDELSGFRR